MNNPLVSICIPTFNGEEFLREALDSVLAQNYRNLEIIVSDDNSNDNTMDILRDYQKNSNFPFYIYNHKPKGIGANWNNCIRHANGEYIKFLFQDDVLYFDCIKEMLKAALCNHNIGLVFSKRTIIFDQDNQKHLLWVQRNRNLHKNFSNLKQIQKGVELMRDFNFFNSPRNKIGEPSSILFKRDVFFKVGFFSIKLKQSLDYEFCYRVFCLFDIAFIDKELSYFRLHDRQTTNINKLNKVDEFFPFYKEFKNNTKRFMPKDIKKELNKKILNCYKIKFQKFIRILCLPFFLLIKKLISKPNSVVI